MTRLTDEPSGTGNVPALPQVPRLAATVILMRDGAAGPEVFMVVRHHAIDFASGALVFPGGRLEEADRALAADPVLCPSDAGVVGAALALRVGAIRETFEECGVLLARPEGSDALVDAGRLRTIASAQAPGRQDADGFAALLRAERLVLATDLLTPFAHWITPVTYRKRYDTLFLMVRAPDDQLGVHDGSETIDSVWIRPADAIEQAAAGRYKLVFATLLNLQKLARHASVALALEAARTTRLVTVVPEAVGPTDSGVRCLRLPAEADYGGELFTVDLPPAV